MKKIIFLLVIVMLLISTRTHAQYDGCSGPYPFEWQGRIANFVAYKNSGATIANFTLVADYWVLFYQLELVDEHIMSDYLIPNSNSSGDTLSYTFPVETTGCVRLWKYFFDGHKEVLGLVRAVQITSPPTAIKVSRFYINEIGKKIVLNWNTSTEYNLIGFHIEKSADNKLWQRITKQIIPSTGTNMQPQKYQFVDPFASKSGIAYYRLIEIDIYGKENVVAKTEKQVQSKYYPDSNQYER